ncbi:MAG: hypothetical protein ACSLE1_21090 [Sphingobium sp.]
MLITQDQLRLARREIVARPRSISRIDWPDFKVRPISEEWQYCGRVPAYKSAVANVAYIWRDSSPADRFGSMPARFAERRFELKGSASQRTGLGGCRSIQDLGGGGCYGGRDG